jgi:hypothetical protein
MIQILRNPRTSDRTHPSKFTPKDKARIPRPTSAQARGASNTLHIQTPHSRPLAAFLTNGLTPAIVQIQATATSVAKVQSGLIAVIPTTRPNHSLLAKAALANNSHLLTFPAFFLMPQNL